ncbi:MAG: glycosyltransferase family 1 protein, partial [Acidobacteriota bacterium]
MRIAYICADPGVPVFGRKGCSIHVQEVVRGMRKRAARVELFAARLGGDPPPGLESVPIHRLPRPSGPELARREQSCLEANRNLRTRLDRL